MNNFHIYFEFRSKHSLEKNNAAECQTELADANVRYAGTFRRVLPQVWFDWLDDILIITINLAHSCLTQVLASTAKNLLIFDLGMTMAFATVAIPALTGRNKVNNPDEFLHFNAEQASWLGMCTAAGRFFARRTHE